jgi:hypothetical protein
MAKMKDVTELLEERLAGAPIAGTLTSDELAAAAEGEADFAAGFFTVDPTTTDATVVDDEPTPKRSSASR